jgi:hypothetical protein
MIESGESIPVEPEAPLELPQLPQDVPENTLGVFQLTDVDDLEAITPDSRAGASLASWSEDTDDHHEGAQSEQQHSDDFPMIVWLRGDEPWFGEFSLDADAVMEKLGIKRSRLTQISGKELRVGRARIDRYIRPLYRTLDVENYLNWTRATASHKKSSAALKSAADVLQNQGQQIAQVVADATSNFSHVLTSGVLNELKTSMTSTLLESVSELRAYLTANLETQNKKIDQSLAQGAREKELLASQLTVQDMRLDAVESAVTALALRAAEISDRQLKFFEQQSELLATLSSVANRLSTHEDLLRALQTPAKPMSRPKPTPKKYRFNALKDQVIGLRTETTPTFKPAKKTRKASQVP